MKYLVSAFLSATLSLGAKAQMETLSDKKPFKLEADSALTRTIDSIVAAKGDAAYRLETDSLLKFRIHPKSGGIAFLIFADRDRDGVFNREDLTYAEFSDAYAAIVVADTGNGMEVTKRQLARGLFKTNESYIAAQGAYQKKPAPLDKDAMAVAQWIINRTTQKPAIPAPAAKPPSTTPAAKPAATPAGKTS